MQINARRIFDALPECAKNLTGVVLRRIPRFKFHPTKEEESYHNKLEETEWLSTQELKEIQSNKLRRLLDHAYKHVQYYRRQFDERGIKPGDIDTIEALQKLPLLTKDIIRANPQDFISDTAPHISKLTKITTGGSTGTPMKFFFDDHMVGIRRAHWWRWSDFAGVDLYRDRMIYCGGAPERWPYPPEKMRGLVSYTRDRLFLSTAAMSDQVLDRYINDIQRFRGDYVRGYASGVYMLANRILERDLKISMKAVLTSSDTLFPQYRALIERAFDCHVFDHYGQNEDILTATECGKEEGLHINMESCIAETVDADGAVISDVEGQLVSTHLENLVMPLIRYITGDVGKLDALWEKCKCGRSHQKLRYFTGRDDEIIVTPEGRRIACGSMNQPMKTMIPSIKRCQFIQEEIGLLRVKVVPAAGWVNEIHQKELKENIRKQVGTSIGIRVELVDQIPARPNGKYQFIVSMIKEKRY